MSRRGVGPDDADFVDVRPEVWEVEYFRRARRKLFGVQETRDGLVRRYRIGPREGRDDPKPARQGALW